MPYLRNSTLNESSLNMTYKSEDIFHLFSMQYAVYSQNIVLYKDYEDNNKVEFFINLILIVS